MTQRNNNTVIYTTAKGEKYFIGSDTLGNDLKVGDIISQRDAKDLTKGYPYCVFIVKEISDNSIILEKMEGTGYATCFDGYYHFNKESKTTWNVLEPEYKEVGSFHFKRNTPNRVCEIVNNLYKSGVRARFFYGDSDGYDWLEMYDNIGTVGRSMGGRYNVPLLITRRGNLGGSMLMTDSIVRITVDKETVWRNSLYHTDVVLLGNTVKKQTGEIIYNAGDEVKAGKVYEYLLGKRNNA